jgi:hypothetical protein
MDDFEGGADGEAIASGGASPRGAAIDFGDTSSSGEEALDDSECAEGKERRQVRVSMFEVLINTQVAASQLAVDQLAQYLDECLFTKEALNAVIAVDPPEPERILLSVRIIAPVIEIGTKQHRVHCHFGMRIRHAGKTHAGSTSKLIAAHVRANSPFGAPFVSVRLVNMARANYNLKERFVCV